MTKVSFKLIFAALVATAALAGCTKEITPAQTDQSPVSPASEGTRVITVSFAPQTKTSFSETAGGIGPYFVEGDEIVLCSDIENPTEENTQTCEVDVDPETKAATITTKLSGALTAYYPASLVIEGKKGLNIYVPSDQDGTFDKANICSATIAENAASATFNNVYALFAISVPKKTTKLTIKSLRLIGDDGQRSNPIRNLICGTGDDLYKISVGDGTKDILSPCYVAMNDGVNLSDLSFEAASNEEGTTGFIKGIPTSAIAAQAGPDVTVGSEAYNAKNKVQYGTAYTIDNSNWHPYVTVASRKWATMNIGAESPEAYGRYFAWGDITGQEADLTIETIDAEKENAFETGFSEAPTLDPANPAILPLKYDAANANWGGAWRIPTELEFNVLLSRTNSWDSSNKGYTFGTVPNQLFLPAAGGGDERSLASMTTDGHYWTSTLDANDVSKAVSFLFSEVLSETPIATTYSVERRFGASIRAIIDDPDAVTPTPTPTEPSSDYVEIEAMYDGTHVTKLKWYRQNLAISESGGKPWKGGNESAVKVPGTDEDVIVGDYFQWGAYASYCGDATDDDKGLLIYNSFINTKCAGVTGTDGFDFKSPEPSKTYYFYATSSDDGTSVGIYPHYSGAAYTEYVEAGSKLSMSHDVANIILGDNWRMPTKDEFQAMKDVTYWEWDSGDKGYYVYAPASGDEGGLNGKQSDGETNVSGTYTKSDALLFFPATGFVMKTEFLQVGILGMYWSSALYTDTDMDKAVGLGIKDNYALIDGCYSTRHSGLPVRPVKNAPQAQKKN